MRIAKTIRIAAILGLVAMIAGLGCANNEPARAKSDLDAALLFLDQAENQKDEQALSKAVEMLSNAQAPASRGVDKYLGIARAFSALNRYGEAESAAYHAVKYAQALNDVIIVQRTRNALGAIRLAQGKSDSARQLFAESVLRRNRFAYHKSESAHWGCAYQGLGELYTKMGPHRKANEVLATADEMGDPEKLFAEALNQFFTGSHAEAKRLVSAALAQKPQNRYSTLLGFLLLFEKQYDEATNLFDIVADADPEEPGGPAGLGHLSIIQKDYQKAAANLAASLGLLEAHKPLNEPPTQYEAWLYQMIQLGLGWVSANQDLHARAVEHFDLALLRRPDDLLCLLGKGNSLIGLRRLDEAQSIFQKVLKLDPDNQYAFAELAVIKLSQGKDAQAKEMFNKALVRDVRNYTCPYEGLGIVYLRLGMIPEAKERLEQAIRINPDIEYKKYNALARIHMRDGHYDFAKKLLEKSIENFPHDNEAQRLLDLIQELKSEGAMQDDPGFNRNLTQGYSTVPLGPVIQMELLENGLRDKPLLESLHDVVVAGRIVYVENTPRALDLSGAGQAEAGELIGKHPQAATSLRLDASIITGKFIERINALKPVGLSLTITDGRRATSNIRLLAELDCEQLFLMFIQADDETLAAMTKISQLKELRLNSTFVTDKGLKYISAHAGLRALELADTQITDDGLKALTKLIGLRRLNLSGTKVEGPGMKYFASLSNLKALYLEDTKLTDSGLKQLEEISSLQILNIGGTQISDDGLIEISRLPNLQILELWNTRISDSGLENLAKLKGLRELELLYTAIGDNGLKHLGRLTKLQRLGLGSTKITDEGLKSLSPLTELVTLELWGTNVGDQGLEALAPLERLRHLNLGNTNVTGDGLSSLGHLSELEFLSLSDTGISNSGIRHISALTNLRELELNHTAITDAGAQALTNLVRLGYLDLSGTEITDKTMEHLARLSDLEELELVGTSITSEGLKHLAPLTKLTELGLGGTRITGNGLSALAGAKQLRELALFATPVGDGDLAILGEFPGLRVLELGGTNITCDGLAKLPVLPQLTELGLGDARIADHCLEHLAKQPNLSALKLWFTDIMDAGLSRLADFPHLRRLELGGTAISGAGLDHLKDLSELTELEIGLTKATVKEIANLQSLMPTVDIVELGSF
jgi:internalin A